MKNIVLIFLILNVIQFGQTYKMNINLKDGSTVEFSVEDIRKLTFESSTEVKNPVDLKGNVESFKVSQNYPNPFNPNTTISYQIPKASLVKINIYNVQGSLVKELYNGFQEEGEYKINWNGTNQANVNAASGIYLFTVSITNQIISKQMILLR